MFMDLCLTKPSDFCSFFCRISLYFTWLFFCSMLLIFGFVPVIAVESGEKAMEVLGLNGVTALLNVR